MNKILLKNKIKYSLKNVLTGSDLSVRKLAMMSVESKNEGPIIWLTGCVHGDEVSGIIVIQEIFKKLQKIGLAKGAIYAFPLMNPIGFETASRSIMLTKEDLNRSFPGSKNGTLAERIADTIFSTIAKTKPTLVIDLHNDWIKSISYTLIDPNPGLKHRSAYEKTKDFALQTGFTVIMEQEEDDLDGSDLKKSLSGSMLLHDIPSLTIELGGSYLLLEKDIHDGINSIFNLLAYLKMITIENKDRFYDDDMSFELRNKILKYSQQPLCPKSGIIRFLVSPGQLVKKGESLARIYNVFGKIQETLIAQHDGIILGYSDSPVALPGFPAISSGVIKK